MLKASNGRRLLRFGLTDGQTEITAVEYSHIPSIPDDIPPGTKVFRIISPCFFNTTLFERLKFLIYFYFFIIYLLLFLYFFL